MGMAFIVDGVLEKKALQFLCSGAPIRMTNLNGKSVEIHALARAISSLIRAFSDRHFPIVIVIDREQRTASSADIEEELEILLTQDGHKPEDLIIASPDRMIENWICAGIEAIDGLPVCTRERRNFDECHGKLTLKTELKQHNIVYRETTIGVDLLRKINPQLAAERSSSFARFAEKLKGYCPKLQASLSL